MDIKKLEELLKDAGDVISEQQLRIRELEQEYESLTLEEHRRNRKEIARS